MKTRINFDLLRCFILITVALILTACAASAQKKEEHVGASIYSLNYSAREVAYIAVEEPGDPNGGGGGDALNPYSEGGSICCFSIPQKWRPDLKVVVVYQLYPDKEYRRSLVSIPPYPNDKAGSIWLIVHQDESVEAVVSKYGPSRPEWPGKIKGYPVPSREYRIKIWEKKVEEQKAYIANGMLRLNDASYTKEEKDRLEKNLEYSKALLNHLLKNKP
jgi:hypothetical protein